MQSQLLFISGHLFPDGPAQVVWIVAREEGSVEAQGLWLWCVNGNCTGRSRGATERRALEEPRWGAGLRGLLPFLSPCWLFIGY